MGLDKNVQSKTKILRVPATPAMFSSHRTSALNPFIQIIYTEYTILFYGSDKNDQYVSFPHCRRT